MLAATYVEWSDSLNVNVEEIDHQHQHLVDLINELYRSIINKTTKDKGPIILEELKIYVIAHFTVEESLMRIFGYPKDAYEFHKREHDLLVLEVKDVILKVNAGSHNINSDLLIFLKRWLIEHICKTDVLLGEFLVTKGIGKNKTWLQRIFG